MTLNKIFIIASMSVLVASCSSTGSKTTLPVPTGPVSLELNTTPSGAVCHFDTNPGITVQTPGTIEMSVEARKSANLICKKDGFPDKSTTIHRFIAAYEKNVVMNIPLNPDGRVGYTSKTN